MEYQDEYKYYLQTYINQANNVTLSLTPQFLVAAALATNDKTNDMRPLTHSKFVQQMNDYIIASVV